jgi:hypothetical protein
MFLCQQGQPSWDESRSATVMPTWSKVASQSRVSRVADGTLGGTLGPPRRYCRKLEAQPVQVFGVALRLLQQLHRQIEIDLGPEQSLDLVPRCGANLA